MLLYLISSEGLCNSDKQSEYLPLPPSSSNYEGAKSCVQLGGVMHQYQSNVNMESYCNKSSTIMQDPHHHNHIWNLALGPEASEYCS